MMRNLHRVLTAVLVTALAAWAAGDSVLTQARPPVNVPGIEAGKFRELAEKAKSECPVSKALGAIEISLDASLA